MLIFVDTEFNRVTHEFVNPVCASLYEGTEAKNFWTHNLFQEKAELKKYIESRKHEIFCSYSVVAEARFFLSLGLNPVEYKFIDLFLEYRCLSNHNDNFMYGEQLVDGKVKKTRRPPPKWERTEEDTKTSFKQTHSLAEATFKLTGKIRDTAHKDHMRDLIISDPKSFSTREREAIMAYCQEDTEFLPEMYEKILDEYRRLGVKADEKLQEEMLLRGKYACLTAKMENLGYPIDYEAAKNFAASVGPLLDQCQRQINNLFPNIKPFKYNRKEKRYSMDQKAIKNWLSQNVDVERWQLTDGYKDAKKLDKNVSKADFLSLSLEAWQRVYDYKHDYPEDKFGAQMVRYLKLKQNLNGFTPSDKKRTFFDSVGPDKRVRPYFNIYGSQSSRSQPSSTSFLFLKPAWMRSMCLPAPGKAIACFDYGSEEFLLAALWSEDENMLETYASGDVYLHYAKLNGIVPMNGTKAEYKKERDGQKPIILGQQFLMSKYGLAAALTEASGKEVTEDEAQEKIDDWNHTYPDLVRKQKEVELDYFKKIEDKIKLPCVGRGTIIKTSNGDKRIEEVSLEDKVWDGEKFVKHGGVVLKGKKTVMYSKRMNLSATPDHLILHNQTWKTMAEVGREEFLHQKLDKFLGDGLLYPKSSNWGFEGMSYVAAYANLKKMLELRDCSLEKLLPVLTALNLSMPKDQNPAILAQFLMTNIFGENGEAVTTTQNLGVRLRLTNNTKTMEVGEFLLASTPLENSWNTLLVWMGISNGTGLWTELTMTGTMNVETYESYLSQLTTKIDVYDILDCGINNRFQAGNIIAHNCGWYMFGDNDNFRSVVNVGIQGLGASIMRKAVEFADELGLNVVVTLHDALYVEYNSGDFSAIDKLHDAMRRGFLHYFPKQQKDASLIRLDGYTWSPDYEEGEIVTPGGLKIETGSKYIDERSTKEYETFKKYFETRIEELL